MVRNQKGFTLIELIVVIVILGILAAVAFPKFQDLSGDAQQAVVNGTGAAVKSAAVLLYAKNGASKNSVSAIIGATDYDASQITISGSDPCAAVVVKYTANTSRSVSLNISEYCS